MSVAKKWLFNDDYTTNPEQPMIWTAFITTIPLTCYSNGLKKLGDRIEYDPSHDYGYSFYYSKRGHYIGCHTIRDGYVTLYQEYKRYDNPNTFLSGMYRNNEGRLITFDEEPTGDLFTLLNAKAQPINDGNVFIATGIVNGVWNSSTSKYDFTKQYYLTGVNAVKINGEDISLDEIKIGKNLTHYSVIELTIDQGCSSIIINEVEYVNNIDSVLMITDDDIVIKTAGTQTGVDRGVLKVIYINSAHEKTYDLSQLGLSAGIHEVKVKARAIGFRDSDFSNVEEYTVEELGG